MRRRTALRTIAVGVGSVTAGCSQGEPAQETPRPNEPGTLTYPELSPVSYSTWADIVDDPEQEPREFAAYAEAKRVAIANAIHRARYRTTDPPGLRDDDPATETIVAYRGQSFDVGTAVGDTFEYTPKGPSSTDDWPDPVAIDATVENGELTVELTNELDRNLDAHYDGRPYFGVLVAVGQSPVVLDHDAYETNEHIDTDGIVQSELVTDEPSRETLQPNDALRETYTVPDGLTGESLVRVSQRIGGESVDRFGNRSTIVATTLRVEF